LSNSVDDSASEVDRNRLAERYRLERSKRLNPKGNAQYIAVEGVFADFSRDPYVEAPANRPPSTESVDVLIVGGGIAGLLTAVELRRAGVESFQIIEKGADFGGTWYWNRYPGIACDCESLIYIPLLEELGYTPTAKYAPGEEIGAHLRKIGDAFGLYANAFFQTQVTGIVWSTSDERWLVSSDRGDEIRARFIVLGSGPLHRPKLPGIPGIREFKGRQFHSSRWDYEYSGGGPRGGLDKLRDKRVAVVGTGSTEPGWTDRQESGWQRRRMENFDAILAGIPQDDNMVADQWAAIWGRDVPVGPTDSIEDIMAMFEDLDFAQMERIRARVDELVDDPATAEALKPYYSRFCKRPTFNDEYLQAFNRPNVTLIDTDGRGLDRITETGIVFDGREYAVDCIVYATGFEFAVATTRSGGFEVYSPSGQALSDHRAEGIRSLHGISVHGFPNMFIVGGIHQAGISINVPLVFGGQARHASQVIKQSLDLGATTVEVRSEAQRRWGEVIAEKSQYNPEAMRNCTPGAYTNENTDDHERARGVFATAYGGGPIEYLNALDAWRVDGIQQDLEFRIGADQSASGSEAVAAEA
jgi:cyclohexanone monooxygenase